MCNATLIPINVPMNLLYHPPIDTSKLCSPSDHSRYRSLLRNVNRMVPLIHLDNNYAVNRLALYYVALWIVYFQELHKIFVYLKENLMSIIFI